MNRKTIIFVGHDATRTGAPKSLLNIVKWFSENTDYAFAVVLGNDGPLIEEYKNYASVYIWNDNEKRHRVLIKRIYRKFCKIFKLTHRSFFESHNERIINTLKANNIKCIFNNTGVNGRILEALKPALNAPIISRIPELEAYMRKNNQNGSVDKILALSDYFVAVSQAVKENLVIRHLISPEKISVIYGACDKQNVEKGVVKLREKLGLPNNVFVIGACGTMDWRKGVDLFIQVANRAVNHLGIKDIYFCWIGGSVSIFSDIEYKYEVELLNLKDHLFFIGEVEDTSPYLADMNVFLLTSREDPFPLVMLEAARQGLPIVCFENSGGATEFIDNKIGIKVPMLDINEMTQAVIRLKQKPEICSAFGVAAYEKSLEYSSQKMGKSIFDTLTKTFT